MWDGVVSWLQLQERILCLIVACIWDIMMRYGYKLWGGGYVDGDGR